MSKVTYIIKASNDTLNEKTAAILVTIVKNNFITSAEVREKHEDLGASSVNSNIGVLIKKGLIEKSGDGLVATGEAMDIINSAADLFAAEQKPELLEKRNTRKPRGTTGDMELSIEEIKAAVEERGIEVKEIEVNRSNMGVVLAKRHSSGIRKLEVMRNGIFRVFGYKVNQETLDKLSSFGMTYRVATSGNAYIDIAYDAQIVGWVVEIL